MTLEIKNIDFKRYTANEPVVIAGPCSAETEEQVITTAAALKEGGVNIFRAGVWKPRTRPGGFEGCGVKALPWLRRVKEELGMAITTEVATPDHVKAALDYGVDILWVGARTTSDPFAVQALAESLEGVDIPVMVKNPVSPDIDLWIGAMQRINRAGIKHIAAVHRGFYHSDHKLYRNPPMWNVPIELRRRIPELQIICDPSHIGGRRDLIAPLSQYAMDLGFDGLIIESHCMPDDAWSDASQQVTPSCLHEIISSLVMRSTCDADEPLMMMRKEIDELDDSLVQILARRMEISRRIGDYKRVHKMTILQTDRYNEILSKITQQGELTDIDSVFLKRIFDTVHEESVRQQVISDR